VRESAFTNLGTVTPAGKSCAACIKRIPRALTLCGDMVGKAFGILGKLNRQTNGVSGGTPKIRLASAAATPLAGRRLPAGAQGGNDPNSQYR
jgi:hypothetical protein